MFNSSCTSFLQWMQRESLLARRFLAGLAGLPFPACLHKLQGKRRWNKFRSIFSSSVWCCAPPGSRCSSEAISDAGDEAAGAPEPLQTEFLNLNSKWRAGGKLNENKYFLAPLNQSLLQSKQPFVCSQCPGASFVKNYTCARSHRESLFDREDPSGVKGSWGMLLMLYLCPRVSWSLCGLFVRCPTRSGLILQLLLQSSW